MRSAVDIEIKETGARWRDDELHVWEPAEDGRVAGLRHYVDTGKAIAGWGLTLSSPSGVRTA